MQVNKLLQDIAYYKISAKPCTEMASACNLSIADVFDFPPLDNIPQNNDIVNTSLEITTSNYTSFTNTIN